MAGLNKGFYLEKHDYYIGEDNIVDVEGLVFLLLPLLAMIILVLLREKIGVKSSKKHYMVGIIIGGTILVVYMIWNFFYRT